MASSWLKNLWNAVKPPPAVPRRVQPDGTVSLTRRFWDAVKPPPPALRPGEVISPEKRRFRRRMLALTALAVLIAVGGWRGSVYIASAPQRAAAAMAEGISLAAAGNYNAAVERFTNSIDTWPNLPKCYLERGLAYQNLGKKDLALADFETAIRADPSTGAAHNALGSLFRERGDTQRALSEFSQAIDLDGDLDAHYQRGQVSESLGEHQKAIADFDIAISQMRNSPYVYLARAASREKLGDHDGAQEDRKTAADLQNHLNPIP